MDKRTRRAVAAVLLLLGAGAAWAQGAQRPIPGLGVPYLIPPSAVKLDEQQRQALVSLRRELHARYCELSARLIGMQEQLRAASGQTPQASVRIAQQIDELHQEARTARAAAMERAKALLSEEQRVTLAKWREGRRDGGGEAEEVPYTVLPSIKSDEPDVEDLEDATLDPDD